MRTSLSLAITLRKEGQVELVGEAPNGLGVPTLAAPSDGVNTIFWRQRKHHSTPDCADFADTAESMIRATDLRGQLCCGSFQPAIGNKFTRRGGHFAIIDVSSIHAPTRAGIHVGPH